MGRFRSQSALPFPLKSKFPPRPLGFRDGVLMRAFVRPGAHSLRECRALSFSQDSLNPVRVRSLCGSEAFPGNGLGSPCRGNGPCGSLIFSCLLSQKRSTQNKGSGKGRLFHPSVSVTVAVSPVRLQLLLAAPWCGRLNKPSREGLPDPEMLSTSTPTQQPHRVPSILQRSHTSGIYSCVYSEMGNNLRRRADGTAEVHHTVGAQRRCLGT